MTYKVTKLKQLAAVSGVFVLFACAQGAGDIQRPKMIKQDSGDSRVDEEAMDREEKDREAKVGDKRCSKKNCPPVTVDIEATGTKDGTKLAGSTGKAVDWYFSIKFDESDKKILERELVFYILNHPVGADKKQIDGGTIQLVWTPSTTYNANITVAVRDLTRCRAIATGEEKELCDDTTQFLENFDTRQDFDYTIKSDGLAGGGYVPPPSGSTNTSTKCVGVGVADGIFSAAGGPFGAIFGTVLRVASKC